MKKSFCCLLAVALLFASCQKQELPAGHSPADLPEQNTEPAGSEPSKAIESDHDADKSEEEYYYPARENTVVSDEIAYGADELVRDSLPKANLKESYVFIKSLNCDDIFFWDYEAYLPRFTDEIPHDGAQVIQQYYQDRADATEEDVRQFAENGFEGYQMPMSFFAPGKQAPQLHLYTYQNYSVDFLDPYLTVLSGSYVYLGGTHGLDSRWCDNFDMRTGEKLNLDDVFCNLKRDAAFLNAYINNALSELYGESHTVVDIMQWQEPDGFSHDFRLTKEGVDILFDSYEIGPYAYGMPTVTLPYREIQELIQIAIVDFISNSSTV